MKNFEIYWDDLSESCKNLMILNGFQYDKNMDVFPLFVLTQEEYEEGEN